MNESEESVLEEICKIFSLYHNESIAEFHRLITQWPTSLNESHIFRVMGALAARQAHLALLIVTDPALWNPHIAPLLLRSLLENWLKIEWLMQDPANRVFGIAKADLIGAKNKLEKSIAGSKMADRKADLLELIANEEKLFESPAKPELIDPRTMAQKAGGEALHAYRRHYLTFSSCTHSAWNHIARFNLVRDPNPLHRYQLVPTWPQLPIDPNFPLFAAEYCHRAFVAISPESMNKEQSSFSQLLTELEKQGFLERSSRNQSEISE